MAAVLLRALRKPRLQVLGLMSGTSLDGLDCALCEIAVPDDGGALRLCGVRARSLPYDDATRARLHRLMAPTCTARELCQASFFLGELFAELAGRFLADLGVAPGAVDLIGSHGQTVWHQPPSACGPGDTPSTLQIGEPAVLAARLGVLTIGDFRVADVALGGEGAPLVPFVDQLLFYVPGRRRALQNLGGIANVSLVSDEPLLAFDNGPCNMLLDALAERASGGALAYDKDGALSAAGQVLPDVLEALLDDEYLRRPPPKSTGRERYGRAYSDALWSRFAGRRPEDLLRTAVELCARAISDSLRGRAVDRAAPYIDEVLLSGGGAHNRTLRERIAALVAPATVRALEDDVGIDVDNKEAVAFAVLAAAALHGRPASVPTVTGARGPAVLGKLCLPPP